MKEMEDVEVEVKEGVWQEPLLGVVTRQEQMMEIEIR